MIICYKLTIKNMKKIILALALLVAVPSVMAQEPLWQGKGRIAISSDGNEHDDDDWAATPLSLALLASQGLQDKLVLYTYSDHIWGSNQEQPFKSGMTAYEHMRESALGGKERFGFDNSEFICAVDNAHVAYEAMKNVINESTEDNPLIIIAAGPMQVVGEALNRADKRALKYVTVLSHSWWNDNHSEECYIDLDVNWLPKDVDFSWDNHTGWTWKAMEKAFSPTDKGGVKFVHICDQNGGEDYDAFQAHRDKFDWLKTSKARKNKAYKEGSWDWLYSRIACCPKGDNFDPSDTGMVVYMLTGIEKTEPYMAQELMENPVVK